MIGFIPDYPPGVSSRDIDRHFGSEDFFCGECDAKLSEDETQRDEFDPDKPLCAFCADNQ